MAVTISPRFRSVSGSQDDRQIGYVCRGATDDNDCLDALESGTPLTYDGLSRSRIELDEVDWNAGIWFATVTYSKATRSQPESGQLEYAFDISLTTQRIVQSNSTINSYVPATKIADDFKKAMAVDADGVAQGVDIRIPISSFELRYYPLNAVVSSAYQKTVRDAVGKVNSTTFNGHDAGEVLFVGCSGGIRSDSDWELTYRFETSPNQTGLTIGDITGIAVDGWDVLWVYYRDAKSDQNRFIQKPVQVNIERVYERIDFATVLGI